MLVTYVRIVNWTLVAVKGARVSQGFVWFMDLESEIWGRGVGLCPARKAGEGEGGEKGEGSREKPGGENKHCWSPRTVEKVHN